MNKQISKELAIAYASCKLSKNELISRMIWNSFLMNLQMRIVISATLLLLSRKAQINIYPSCQVRLTPKIERETAA